MFQIRQWIVGLSLFLIEFDSGCSIYAMVASTKETEIFDETQLSKLNITSILMEIGDIPNGFYPGEITHLKPSDFPDDYYYKFVQADEQKIITTDETHVGEVIVYL